MSKANKPPRGGDAATNRQARHKYEITETIEAGIVLLGTEVKSLREGKAQIADSYALIDKGEVFIRGMHIPPYRPAANANHDPERVRKLLLNRYEIDRLVGRLQRKGLTLVPTRVYFKAGRAKVELGLGRGKQAHDKRADIRDRDVRRELERDHSQRMR